jgi:glycosyltransferase involved in cell wall biosynthesis
MTILEAFASGRPVIATDVGAVSKVVIPNQTGMLLKQKDSSAIAEAILTLIKSPDLRARLGREGRSLVREMYSSRAMSEQYVQLYEKLRERKTQVAAPVAVP